MAEHSPDQETTAAASEQHHDQPGPEAYGTGVPKLVAMLSIGKPDPAEVAKLIALHPQEQVAMLGFLQKMVGNSYVQRVIALEKAPMPANTGPSAKEVNGAPTGSKAREALNQ